MIDLSNATFIIPVRIDSEDRLFNFKYVINYLCTRLKTNILVHEDGPRPIATNSLETINSVKTIISYHFEENNNPLFHRTKILNKMLSQCKTDVVVNYDCDIILKPNTYLKAYNSIIKDGYDLVYPYFIGLSQKMVVRPGINDDLTDFVGIKHLIGQSDCGHCQFFKRSSYISGGMENENFKSYGPEDTERKERFIKLGYNVTWLTNDFVYHLEHARGENSDKTNPYFKENEALYNKLHRMNKSELTNYYKNIL